MASSNSIRNRARTLLAGSRFERDLPWLAAAVGLTALLSVVYYLTHPFPAYGAGLYLEMAERIVANGYAPPETIPGWTADGVPFAYPPLLFYVVAVLIDLGADPMGLVWWFPMVTTAAYIVAFYYAGRELLGSTRRAGIAAVLAAVTPPVFQWHLSAGGIVRAPAFLFVMLGLYAGVKLFKTSRRPNRWLVPATVLFGLTVLSHPMHAEFFGIAFLLLFLAFDRSLAGLVRGGAVALGGVILAAPWWLRVLVVYGQDTITAASGTRSGGMFGNPTDAWGIVLRWAQAGNVLSPIYIVIVLCAVLVALQLAKYLYDAYVGSGTVGPVRRDDMARKLFLVGWIGASAMLLFIGRYHLVPAVLLIGTYAADASLPDLPWSRVPWPSANARRYAMTLAVVAFLAFVTVAGGATAAHLEPVHDHSLTSLMHDGDGEAMEWVQSETPEDATFVVLGRGGEWFPYLTDRTMLISPWGTEWEPGNWQVHKQAHRYLSFCDDADCLTQRMDAYNVRPDYVYVQKKMAEYEDADGQNPEMHRSLEESPRYRVVYENEGATVAEVCYSGDCGASQGSSARSERSADRAAPRGVGSVPGPSGGAPTT